MNRVEDSNRASSRAYFEFFDQYNTQQSEPGLRLLLSLKTKLRVMFERVVPAHNVDGYAFMLNNKYELDPDSSWSEYNLSNGTPEEPNIVIYKARKYSPVATPRREASPPRNTDDVKSTPRHHQLQHLRETLKTEVGQLHNRVESLEEELEKWKSQSETQKRLSNQHERRLLETRFEAQVADQYRQGVTPVSSIDPMLELLRHTRSVLQEAAKENAKLKTTKLGYQTDQHATLVSRLLTAQKEKERLQTELAEGSRLRAELREAQRAAHVSQRP
eukprot:PhF_6_TR13574/c0_g1_i1/m.21708